jgi:hypothetical protein
VKEDLFLKNIGQTITLGMLHRSQMTNPERSRKMTHVIGLFSRDLDYNRSFNALRAAGLNPEKLGLVTREQLVGDVLGCGSARIVTIYAGAGGLLGLSIYGISALLASWCQCNLFQFSQMVQIGTLIGGILAGVFVGGSLGIFFGISKLEAVTTIYFEGKRKDGKVLNVKAKNKQADQIKDVLQRAGAYEVVTI